MLNVVVFVPKSPINKEFVHWIVEPFALFAKIFTVG
jgi:hypothetical protein